MLSQARTNAALPASDLGRARRAHESGLRLVPAQVTGANRSAWLTDGDGVLFGIVESATLS